FITHASRPPTATPSLHDALPICRFGNMRPIAPGRALKQAVIREDRHHGIFAEPPARPRPCPLLSARRRPGARRRSGQAAHLDARDRKSNTSELQSRENLVCRLLL